MNTAETLLLYAEFLAKVEGLKGDDLLDEMIALQRLPPPLEGEQELRLLQTLCLEVALMQSCGIEWRRIVENRRGTV